jgi:dolichol-phosphate mannosyltransferase
MSTCRTGQGSDMKTFVMLPTYNEKANIGPLIKEIFGLGLGNLEILVVDDNSPDGTGEAVKSLFTLYPSLHLMVRRSNRGRGLAGIEGFKYCQREGADLIIEMDADFSHAPSHIPDFIAMMDRFDLVIGSRFLQGGRNRRPDMGRNLITRVGRAYINFMLGTRVTDPTSGYRCYRRELMEAVHLETLVSEGPSVLQEILFKAQKLDFRIGEIPITFKDRLHGKSTFNRRLMVAGFIMVLIFRVLWSKPGKAEEADVFRPSGPASSSL